MIPRVRWYNRLAAWLYVVMQDALMGLAMPVWEAEAEADLEAMWEAEARATAVEAMGWADGVRAAAEYDGEVPF